MITSGVGQLDFIGPDFLVGGAGHTLVRSFIRVHCVVDHQGPIRQHGHSVVL